MTFHVPAWVRTGPAAPPALPVPVGPVGQVVALVAADGAVVGGWAAEVALELADGWSEQGVRVVLADGGLEAPSLHEALGEAPREGLVDALRWGASMRRVAQRPAGRSFFTITAGTPVADGPAVFAEPRWEALCAGFRDAGVTLVVLVPARDPCLGAVVERAAGVIVLAAPGEEVPAPLDAGAAPVLAVLGRERPEADTGERLIGEGAPIPDVPPQAATPDGASAYGEPIVAPDPSEPEPASGMEDLLARSPTLDLSAPAPYFPEALPDAAQERSGGPEEEARPPAAEEPLPVADEEPPPLAAEEPSLPAVEESPVDVAPEARAPGRAARRSERLSEPELYGDPVPTFEEIVEEYESVGAAPRRGRRATWAALGVVALVLVAGVIAAALLGYLKVPGISPLGGAHPGGSEPEGTGEHPTAAPPATEASAPAPFSVAFAALGDEAAAGAMVEELSGKAPGVLFMVVPVELQGEVLHRVLAGAASDSAAALELGARIAGAAALGEGAWVARRTPRAFQLGEMPELDAARRRSEVLQGLRVPSYVLAVTYSDGSVRFRVYAGAFADDTEATYLSGLLHERGLSSATLSERIGRLPE